jgi:serine/threonine-protein kinase
MADIFLSYASEDRERVLPLVEALEGDGFSVWWDRSMYAGTTYDREIETAIKAARCMVVVWSEHSVESEWVRSEVEEGVRTGILVPVLMDDVLPPLAHRRRQSANLTAWVGESDAEYELLLTGIRATLLAAGQPESGEREAAVTSSLPPQPTAIPSRRRRPSSTLSKTSALVLAALCGGGIAAIATWISLDPGHGAPRPVRQFTIELPRGVTIANAHSPLDISADGRHIVFNAATPSGNQLYIRSLSTRDAAPIEGVGSGLASVFVSPDGEWIGFYDSIESELKKVRVSGGRRVTLAEVENPYGLGFYGASWGRNGDIAFFSFDDFTVMRVSEEGGIAAPLIEQTEGGPMQPHFLADGRALVYTVGSVGSKNGPRFRIAVLSLDTGEQRILVEDGHSPRVASSGHLLFARDGAVWAVAFDPERLEVHGQPVRVLEDVLITTHAPVNQPSAHFHIADDGTLVYRPKETAALGRPPRNLVWVDRQGHETPLAALPKHYSSPRIAPDGRRIAVLVNADGQEDIWIYSVERGTSLRLTSHPATEYFPIWSHDGERVAFASDRNGAPDIFWKSADGTGAVEPLIANSTSVQIPSSWSSDGNEILFFQSAPGTQSSYDIWVLSLNDERTAKPLLQAEFSEDFPAFSPDGQWIAYVSDQSGRSEVYLRPYPNVSTSLTTVSTHGGSMPTWSPDGREIFYEQWQLEGQLVAVPFDDGVLGQPQVLLDLSPYLNPTVRGSFDIHPDGKRFLLVKEQSRDELPDDRIVVVLNWLEEVKRLVPTD